jgi:hypothetical protein
MDGIIILKQISKHCGEKGVNQIQQAQNRIWWRLMKLWVLQQAGNFLNTHVTTNFSRRNLLHDVS